MGNEYVVMELVTMGSLDTILPKFGAFLRTRLKLSICEQVGWLMVWLVV